MSTARFEERAVISGAGTSAVGRRLGVSDLSLTIDAALAAISDAGLTVSDIDGLATWPGRGYSIPGLAGATPWEVQDALRLRLDWHHGGPDGPGQLGAVIAAVGAVATGLARHVLVYRTVTESSAQGAGGRGSTVVKSFDADLARGPSRWSQPFGMYGAVNQMALYAQRHMHEFGTTREQVGSLVCNTRAFAGLNPAAIYRDPLTLDDYLSARMISTPFGLYDCDVPCDGSVAFVVSTAEYVADAPRPPVRVEAVGSAMRGRPSFEFFEDMATMAARDAAAHLWSRTDLRPADVDVAELYDGFSWLTIMWLEALGFCGRGEGGQFVSDAGRIGLHGELPLNTGGGQLSAGRLHGFGVLHEACVQLWGLGGARQVDRAEVAVVGVGGGPIAGAMLLTRGG